jgi:hypothetical protein
MQEEKNQKSLVDQALEEENKNHTDSKIEFF